MCHHETRALATLGLLLALAVPSVSAAQVSKARELVRSGAYDEAERALAPLAVRKGREGAEATVLLGRVRLETGRYEEAVREARGVAGEGGTRAAARLLEGEALLKVGRTVEAVRALRGAVEAAGRSGDEFEWRSRLLLARALERSGDRLGARALYDALADEYNDGRVTDSDAAGLWAVASAVAALEYWADANETFAAATKADPSRVETQTDWARLFLAKYDPGHAEECLREALKANPRHAEAHALMARVRMRQAFDFVRAGEELDAALATDPSLAEAHAFRATLQVRDRLWEAAHEDLDRALAVDPSDPYALSVKAAAHFIADDRSGYDATVARLRKADARFTGHIAILTDLLEWEHRYEEIVEVNREALRADPTYWPAHAAIGLNLLRMGEDDEGVAALRQSWSHDRFHVLVYNTLNLYEDVLTKEYSYQTSGPIRYRFHNRDQKVLERYLPPLLDRAYREMSKRYRVRPARTTVEVFATEDHFSRRSVGLPHAGVQGICFGRVVVAAGPRAVPVNYGQVLWHELGHVFSIQASKARVPRWFTEGLAVLEETRGDPSWVRGDDAALRRWVEAGRMPGVGSLNTAFSRARSGTEIGLAYYGSAKLTGFIVERHGWPRILRMLELYGRGKRTPEVVREALGVSPAELDAAFRDHVLKSLGRHAADFQIDYGWHYDREALEAAAAASPRDAAALGRAAVAAMAGRAPAVARSRAEKAIALDPGERRARHVLADIAAAKGDWPGVRAHAGALIDRGVDGYGLRLSLASAAEKAGDRAEAHRHLREAALLDPQQVEPHARLAKLLLDGGSEAEALGALLRATELDPHDRGLHRELLARLAKRGSWDLVRRHGERALWVDPLHPETHRLLARGLAEGGDRARAAFEYESALLCEPEDPAAIHMEVARMWQKAGQHAKALGAARRALEADSSRAEARRLVDELSGPGSAPAAPSGSRRR